MASCEGTPSPCLFYTSLPPFKDHANIHYIREEGEVRRRTEKAQFKLNPRVGMGTSLGKAVYQKKSFYFERTYFTEIKMA